MSLTVHIGFDFWGAGNIGDDFVLAGFLAWLRQSGVDARVSALCGHDIEAMRSRFPEVEWFPSDRCSREAALSQTDVWFGLGGSPFQSDLGTWLLDQLVTNLEAARARAIPTFLVGVGLNDLAALTTPQARKACDLVDEIWLRDEFCLRHAFDAGFPGSKTRLGADAAHLFFASRQPSNQRSTTALVLHTAKRTFSPPAIADALRAIEGSCDWFCQEVRNLEGTETDLFALLDDETQKRLALRRPDYRSATRDELADAYSSWSLVLSSRYHSTLAAAWNRAAVTVFERNDKLRGIREELCMEVCSSLTDAAEISRALTLAKPVSPAILEACANRADSMLRSVFARAVSGTVPTQRRVHPSEPLVFESGWYDEETDGAGWWRWCGGAGRIILRARTPGRFVLSGRIRSLRAPDTIRITCGTSPRIVIRLDDAAFRPLEGIAVHLDNTPTILHLESTLPADRPPGDRRALAFAVSDLRLDPTGESRHLAC